MGRPPRIEYPGALYHITSRGNQKSNIFIDQRDYNKFLEILRDHYDRYDAFLFCYVLMPNHYHFAMETPRGNESQVMYGINTNYALYFNSRYRREGYVLQGRYHSIVVDKDSYLLALSRYIHLNPVRAGLVKRPEEYRWSSYPIYMCRAKPVEWIKHRALLSLFSNNAAEAVRLYQRFVEKALPDEKGNPFKNMSAQNILGDREFVHRVRSMMSNEQSRDNDTTLIKPDYTVLEAKEIIRQVTEIFAANEDDIIHGRKRNNTARKAALYLVSRYSGLSLKQVGDMFGGIHSTAVSKSVQRFQQEIQSNPQLNEIVTKFGARH